MKRYAIRLVMVIFLMLCAGCATSKISVTGSLQSAKDNTCVGFVSDDPLSEALSTELMGYGFRVVERSRIKAILGEQHFAMSGGILPKDFEELDNAGVSGIEYLVMVRNTPCEDFPDRLQSATVKFVNFRNGSIALAVNYTNGSGGAPGSPADANMKDRIPESAQKIASEIAKKLQ